LDPTSRRVRLPEGSWAIATDTVGFIQRLPTTLVAAFRATLEEVGLADCLILMSDATAANRAAQDGAVDAILSELGADGIPRVRILNKADLLGPRQRHELERFNPGTLLISAESREGLPETLERVQELLSERWLLRELDVPAAKARNKGEVYRGAQVLSETHLPGKTRYRLRVTPENWERLKKKLAQ